MESLPPEHIATEPPAAWELRTGGEPDQTSALTGNFLRLALTHSSFQDPGSFTKFAIALSEVSRLLWFLHQNRIVHRDLTPDHILLADGVVTLIGFLPPPALHGSSSVDAAFIGTPGYAPPEQARGEEILEPKSDIFSLGAVIYEALTNQIPFQGTGMALKLATITEDPPPIRKFAPLCPAPLVSLCEIMLSKEPSVRPSAEEVQLRLLEIAGGFPELHLPLFSGKKHPPTSAPTPPKTEPERFSTEEQLNRLLPLRAPPIKLHPFDTRSPGSTQPMTPKWRYFYEREVGQGGIGRVSQAHDQRLQRPVAIKELLNPENADAKERFLREALLTARLQHPAIVPIYDVGVRSSGEIFYSMRLISGKPLNEAADEKPFYDRLALLPHLLTVAEAIAYAHSQKIIHRDLKPQNILIGEFGETFVIDWGSAKDLTEHEDPPKNKTPKTPYEALTAQEVTKTPELTLEGSIIGTPAYMAPEQAMGKRAKETADVYALGAILYHLLAGKAPVRDKDKIMQQAQDGVFTPLREVEPQTPDELLTIAQKAMSKDPAARYPTALSFANDLRRYQSGQLIYSHKYSMRERFFKYVKQHKQAFAVGAAAFVLMAAGAAYSIHQIIQEKEATQRSLNDLTLLQARNELNSNPAKSIAWLKRLPPGYEGLDKARIIASDAVRKGIPSSMEGHTGRVNAVAYSPNGETIASADSDGAILIWSPKDRQAPTILTAGADSGGVIQFEYSNDGELIAAAYSDSTVRVWNVAQRKITAELKTEGSIIFCTFSPDTTQIATTGEDGITYLWSLATGEKTEIFRSTSAVHNVQFSPNGDTLAAAVWLTENSQVQLYPIRGGPVRTLPVDPNVKFIKVLFSPKKDLLAASGYGGAVYLWNILNGSVRKLEGHTGSIQKLAFSPDGTKLATGGQDKFIKIWNTDTGKIFSDYKAHRGGILDIEFSHDGKLLASSSGDKTIQIWNLENHYHRILRRHEDSVTSISFSSDDKILASSGFDSSIFLWDIEKIDRKLLFQQEDPVFAVAISDDGSLLAAQKDDQILLWTTPRNSNQKIDLEQEFGPEQNLGSLSALAISMAFSPKNRFLAVSDVKGRITIFDRQQKTSKILNITKDSDKEPDPIQKISFLNEYTIISASNDDTIKIWNILLSDEKTLEATLIDDSCYESNNQKCDITSFAIYNDKTILSVGLDKKIKIWNLNNKSFKYINIEAMGYDITLSPDKTLIAVATPSTAVHVWETASLLETETPILTLLEGHDDLITKVSFIGDLLLSASADSTIRMWDLGSKESSVWTGHSAMVGGLAVARKAKLAISASVDGSVRLWWEDVPEDTEEFLEWLQTVPSATIPDKIVP